MTGSHLASLSCQIPPRSGLTDSNSSSPLAASPVSQELPHYSATCTSPASHHLEIPLFSSSSASLFRLRSSLPHFFADSYLALSPRAPCGLELSGARLIFTAAQAGGRLGPNFRHHDSHSFRQSSETTSRMRDTSAACSKNVPQQDTRCHGRLPRFSTAPGPQRCTDARAGGLNQ